MAQFFQWVATADEVLRALGETPRAGAVAEVIPSSQGRIAFWVVEKERVPGIGSGYTRDDVKAFQVTEQQMRNFLESRGETIPPNIELRVRPSSSTPGPGGVFINDEVVVVDASRTETKL